MRSLLQSRARQRAVRTFFRLAILSPLAVPIASAESKGNLDGFDDFIAKAMTEFKVPGAAVAVVKDGKIVFAKGYGYRDVARKQPVTGATIFPIASITK